MSSAQDIEKGVNQLLELASSWGGAVVQCNRKYFESRVVNGAPFSNDLGVDYEHKLVFAVTGALYENPGGVILEMGHVFASLVAPQDADEYDFLGWEFMLARKVGLVDEWLDSMDDYSIADSPNIAFPEFGYMELDDQDEVLCARVEHARELGLIIGEEPVSVRT